MTEENEDHTTNYSRWSSSTENVRICVKEGKKQNVLHSFSWKRWLIILSVCIVLALIIGFVVGYLVKRSYNLKASDEKMSLSQSLGVLSPTPSVAPQTDDYQRYSVESFNQLSDLINVSSIQTYINDYKNSGVVYHAGSSAINESAHELTYKYCHSFGIFLKVVAFSKTGAKFEYFEHSQVLLSRPAATNSAHYKVMGATMYENSVADDAADTMKPFVAYTQSGTVNGPPVYVGFGLESDFDNSVNYSGAVCYVRYGKLNPYYMISNAESKGCVGVVLYPDPDEFPDIQLTDRIISNAKRIAGDPLTPGFASYSKHSYRLTINDIVGNYLPPNIPVLTASQEMVIPALRSLLGSDISEASSSGSGSLFTGNLGKFPSTDTNVSLTVNNDFIHEDTFRSNCAYRGDVDADKFVMVGTHHDEAGSGNVDPATGQAIIREIFRLIASNPEVYKPRRSILFITTDASYLDIAIQELIEENLREYGERVVAFMALTGTLSQGPYLQVKTSPPLKNFMKNIIEGFSEVQPIYRGVEGSHYYRSYMSNLAVPVMELSFTKNKTGHGVDTLPICCDATTPNTNEERIKLMAKLHLQAIMRLAGDPFLPYDLMEIASLFAQGIVLVKNHNGTIPMGLVLDIAETGAILSEVLTGLNGKIKSVDDKKIDRVSLRRINDAVIGITRSVILNQGVPMIDPRNTSKVIRNLNNRNMLIGSVSTNDNEMMVFPGLVELFSIDSPSTEVQNEILKHITEIMTSMNNVIDYSTRAIIQSATFTPI